MGPGARGARQGSVPVAAGTRLGSRSPARPPGAASGRGEATGGASRATRAAPAPAPGRAPAGRRLTSAAGGPRRASLAAAVWPPAPPPPSCVSAHPFCRHVRTRPPAPRPPDAGPRRSGARFRRSERKPRREPRSGGRAAGDWGGRVGPRPGRSRSHGAAAARLGTAGAAGPTAMAGYARRPGVTPLSRARSLVVPDGERRVVGRAGPGWGRGGRARGPAARAGRLPAEAGAPSPPGRGTLAAGPPRVVPRSWRGDHTAPAPARGEVALVVIPAPAFCERRSCLPQLDCERPHGRELDSHFFGIRPTFMCYVPSPVLASVGDAGERQA